ncbi:MAG: homeobox domain-containing protein, partial [Candidatus Babeliales bacterium]
QIEALSKQLNLPQKEVKSWFSRHKVATTILATYLICGGLTYWAHCIGKNSYKGRSYTHSHPQGGSKNVIRLGYPEGASTFRKFCGDKLILPFYPLVFAANHKQATLFLVLVLIIAYEIYQGKDSAAVAVWNKLFGKKTIAPAATEVAAEPAQPAAEKEEAAVVAPEAVPADPAIEVVA